MALDAAWKFLKAADFEDIRDDIEAQHRHAKKHMDKLRPHFSKKPRSWRPNVSDEEMEEMELRRAMRQRIAANLNRVDLNHALGSIGEKTRAKEGFDLQDSSPPWHYGNEQFEIDAETGLPYTHEVGKFPSPPGWSSPGSERFRRQGTVEPEEPLDVQ